MAGRIATGLFNALAFAGASYAFSKFNHSDYGEEMKRHDRAQEELAKAKEEWLRSTNKTKK